MTESENAHLVREAWNEDFLDEIAVFPLGKHDDQVDAAVGAFDKLTLHKPLKLTADMFFV
jgi:phage terminase large subunit-like protein